MGIIGKKFTIARGAMPVSVEIDSCPNKLQDGKARDTRKNPHAIDADSMPDTLPNSWCFMSTVT